MNPALIQMMRNTFSDSRHDWDHYQIFSNAERWVCEDLGYCINVAEREDDTTITIYEIEDGTPRGVRVESILGSLKSVVRQAESNQQHAVDATLSL